MKPLSIFGLVLLVLVGGTVIAGISAGTITSTIAWFGSIRSTGNQLQIESNTSFNNLNVDDVMMLGFNITSCTASLLSPGQACYDNEEDTWSFASQNGQIIQLGRELAEQYINREGSLVDDGSVVILSGASGNNPEFRLADGSKINESSFVGIVTTECLNGDLCAVVNFGFVNHINTNAWNVGDKLYMNATTRGKLTNIKPTLPNNPLWVATVIRKNANTGRIFVNPTVDSEDGFLINTLYVQNDTTMIGNLNVSGSIYKQYAQGYYHNETNPLTIVISTPDVYYNVTNYTMVDLYGITTSNGDFMITKSAVYEVDLSVSFVGGNGGIYEFVLFVNNTDKPECAMYRSTSSIAIGSASFNCLVALNQGDTLTLKVEDQNNPAANIAISTMNLRIAEI